MDYLSFLYFLRLAFKEAKLKEIRYSATTFVRKLNKVDMLVDAEDYYKAVVTGI